MKVLVFSALAVSPALGGKGERRGLRFPFRTAAAVAGVSSAAAVVPGLRQEQDILQKMVDSREQLVEGFAGFLDTYGGREYAVVRGCEPGVQKCVRGVVAKEGVAAEELEYRLSVFEDNIRVAMDRNGASGNKAVHGVTKFMDLTNEEFKGRMGLKLDLENEEEMRIFRESSTPYTAPANLVVDGQSRDWRDEGVITPVKDQGKCGSCWSFSTTETMETAALKQGLFPKENPFIGSTQEAVACDHFISMGCNGGNPLFALQYYRLARMEPESAFPYTSGTSGQVGKCKYDKSEGVLSVASTSVVAVAGFGETLMMKHLLADGPLSIAVYAEPWQTYKGGILTADQCRGKMDHAVQLVGINQDDPENPYWIVRNSWNANWGEHGFIRLELGKNTCSIAFMAVSATVKKVGNESVDENVVNV